MSLDMGVLKGLDKRTMIRLDIDDYKERNNKEG